MNRFAVPFAATLLAAVAPPLVAQEAAIPVPVAEAASTPVSAPAAPLPGPRVPEFRPATPSLSATPEPLRRKATHTIVVSTLVLVLALVILVLLIA